MPSQREVLAKVSGEQAREVVATLAALGEKVSGNQQEQKAARMLQGMLAPYMDTCELEGVPVTGYRRGAGRLEVVSPVPLSIPCQVNILAGPGRGEGLLVDGGNGTARDYGGDVRGKVVLVTSDGIRHGGVPTHLALEAKRRGASCLLIHFPETARGLIHIWPVDAQFPVLSISNHSARELRKLLAEHGEVRVRFEANPKRYESTSYNVVGTLQGKEFPREVIYLTGHYDNWFSGANDNASTVACILEAARALRGYRCRRTLKFIFFGSEESGATVGTWALHGLIGSYLYCQQHRPDLDGEGEEMALAMVNGEMLGYTPRTHLQCTPELIPLAQAVAKELGDHIRVSGPAYNWTLSDHLCFQAQGVPIIYPLPPRDLGTNRRSPYWSLYHTTGDNLETVTARALESNSRLFTLLALLLDGVENPYSLDNLLYTALGGVEELPNWKRLANLLEREKAHCEGIADRQERLRSTLRFIRLVNQNIYAYDRPFGQKFQMLSERTARLQEAYHILEMEADLERARAVLLTLPDFAASFYFSQEVVGEIKRKREENPLIAALALLEMDWSEFLEHLTGAPPQEQLLAALKAKIKEAQGLARTWGQRFEKTLT